MKKDTLKIFGFMILISVVVATIILFIVNGLMDKRDKMIEEDYAFMDKIEKSYDNFIVALEDFSVAHDEYITAIMDKTSINTSISNNYKSLKETVANYEKYVDELDSDYKFLYDSCYDKYSNYNKKTTNAKCLKYLRNLETTINTFIEDLAYVNTRIDQYNEWTVTYNENSLALTKYSKVEKIVANKYKEYVDLDKDKLFLGRNED